MSRQQAVTLDVREDIRRGREPFGRIMQAVSALSASQDLVLLAPFEPVPLYGVLARHGFGRQVRPISAEEFEIRFSRNLPIDNAPAVTAPKRACPGGPAPAAAAASTVSSPKPGILELDARGLEPPEPMVKILEAAAALAPGAELRARTERRPVHLFPRLEERGFAARTETLADGSCMTYVRRK
jgi:uncharacterized protein (DUF2249 family)